MLQDVRGEGVVGGGKGGVGGVRRAPFRRKARRRFGQWIVAWMGREVLAFPIWAWAFFGGVSVSWRGRKFRVGVDMRVREIIRDGDGGGGGGDDGGDVDSKED